MMNKKIKRAIIIGAILVPAFFIAVIAVTVSTVISDAAAGSTAAQAVETSETGCGTGSLSNSVLAYQPFVRHTRLYISCPRCYAAGKRRDWQRSNAVQRKPIKHEVSTRAEQHYQP